MITERVSEVVTLELRHTDDGQTAEGGARNGQCASSTGNTGWGRLGLATSTFAGY